MKHGSGRAGAKPWSNAEWRADADAGFFRPAAGELAGMLAEIARARSPVRGGGLRRGWKVGPVERVRDVYRVAVENEAPYASSVEHGHRAEGGRWVEGRFFLREAEGEFERIARKALKKRLGEFLRE